MFLKMVLKLRSFLDILLLPVKIVSSMARMDLFWTVDVTVVQRAIRPDV